MKSLLRWTSQRLTDAIASDRAGGLRPRLTLRLRRLLLRFADPIVEYSWYRHPMQIPLSHDLPIHRRSHPQYAENLKRIALVVHRKYESLTVIDVGANVGDSALLLHQSVDSPVLCLEGDAFYTSLLRVNTKSLPHVEIEESFVGSGRFAAVQESRTSGTGRLRSVLESNLAPVRTLSSLLEERPRFGRSKLLKIDTDGWDVEVMRGAEDYIREVNPVIFFEYDPHFLDLAREEDNGFGVFEMLASWGYEVALFYQNQGNFMIGLVLSERDAIRDLHHHVLETRGAAYWDIAVFSQEDRDLFEEIRHGER